ADGARLGSPPAALPSPRRSMPLDGGQIVLPSLASPRRTMASTPRATSEAQRLAALHAKFDFDSLLPVLSAGSTASGLAALKAPVLTTMARHPSKGALSPSKGSATPRRPLPPAFAAAAAVSLGGMSLNPASLGAGMRALLGELDA
ncbi:unnamed protein product, partial [Polarella glacialis]